MSPTTYDMARRAWGKPPGAGANWTQAGSLRGGRLRAAVDSHALADATALDV